MTLTRQKNAHRACLIMGFFACAIGSTFAKTEYWNDSRDLSTFQPTGGATLDVLSLQPKAATKTFTLSKDADLSTVELEMAPYNNGDPTTPGGIIFDMESGGNHTLGLYAYHTRLPVSDFVSTNILVKGGVLDFANSSTVSGSFKGGVVKFLGTGNPHRPVYSGTKFANVWKGVVHSGLSDSSVVFRNGACVDVPTASGSFTLANHAFDAAGGLLTLAGEVRFESGARLTTKCEVQVDSRTASADALDSVSRTPVETEVIFTGAGSGFDAGKTYLGRQVRGQRLLIDDSAVGVCGGSGLVLGSHDADDAVYATEAELKLSNHAILTNRAGLTIGTSKGCDRCRIFLSEEAELVALGTDGARRNLYIGWQSDNNTFVCSNASLSVGAVYFGYQGAPYNTVTGNVARFAGQRTQISMTSAWAPFASSHNTLVFDDITYDKSGKGVSFSFWANVNEASSNNTVRLENGARLALANVLMGRQGASGSTAVACNESVFEILDSELTLDSQFHQSGRDSALVISNGQLKVLGASGIDMAASNGSHTPHSVTGNRVSLQGANPRLVCTASDGHVRFNDAVVTFDVSEAPVDGYDNPVVEAAEITFNADRLSLVGVDELRERMIAAGVYSANFVLAKATTGMTVGNANVAAINEALAKRFAGVALAKNPSGFMGCLVLQFDATPRTVYAVPAGTPGNEPQEPYGSWETAANSIAAAITAAGPFGTVNALSGTYETSGSAGINPPYSASLSVYADQTMTTPGTLTVVQRIWGNAAEEFDTSERNALKVTYGTLFCQVLSSKNFFSDFCSGDTGKWANYSLTVAGENASLRTDGGTFYMGYTQKGFTFRATDHAVCEIPASINFGNNFGEGSSLIVEDGACVTNLGGLAVYGNPNNRVIVSNATFCTSTFSISKPGSGLNFVELTGATAIFKSVANGGSFTIADGCELRFDVSEAPLEGFAEPVLSASSVRLGAGSPVIRGADRLRARLVNAGRHAGRFVLVASAALAIDDASLASANAALSESAPGFSLVKNPDASSAGLVLFYSDGQLTTYAAPSGTAGSTPLFPYDGWSSAASSLRTASCAAGPDGIVRALGGTYETNPSSGINPATSAEFRFYADDSASAPGALTIIQRVFGGTAEAMDDPTRNAFRFGYGTCHLNRAPGGSANFFTDFTSPNGVRANYRISFFGAETVVDSDASAFYIGYLAKGTTLTVSDHASMTLPGTVLIGADTNAVGAALVLASEATVENSSGSISVSGISGSNRLIVSNAVLRTGSLTVETPAEGFSANSLSLLGSAPVVAGSAGSGAISVRSGSRLEFDVGAAPLDGYATVPLSAGTVTLESGAVLSLAGVDTLAARLQKAGLAQATFVLAKAWKGAAFNQIDAEALAAARATLPKGFRLLTAGGKLKLRSGADAGLLIMVK